MTSKQLEAQMTEWLLFKPLRVIAPYCRTNYSLEGKTLTVKRPFRGSISVSIEDLDEIGVETTDQGPFAEDVFWILKQGGLRLRIGHGHSIFKKLMERFGSLQGFDWQPFTEAMCCTDKRYFSCWKRSDASA